MSNLEQIEASFVETVTKYQEARIAGGLEPMTLSPDPTAPQRTRYSAAVTTSDFVVDVETQVRRALDESEQHYFNMWYKSGSLYPEMYDNGLPHVDKVIREKLGQRFMKVGIWPLANYLA